MNLFTNIAYIIMVAIVFALAPCLAHGQSYYPITENGKWSVIDANGNKVLKTTYAYVSDFNKEYAAVKKEGVWGIVSLEGFEKFFPEYKEIKPIRYQSESSTSYFAARKDSEGFALIDLHGTIYSDFAYHD